MRISIALCTYNGARFLRAQLDSFARQDRLPDEVVVCDDGSSDSTIEVVESFAAQAPFPVRLYRNSENLGSTRNFAKAIELCQGDVIALSDQDDVWLPHKLKQMEQAFLTKPTVGFVFSDAHMVDEQVQPLGYSLWECVRLSRSERRLVQKGEAFRILVQRFVVTGATMAFRAKYKELVLPISTNWVHDGWIALLISGVADGCALEEPTVLYRQHAAQQLGEKKRNLYQQYLVAKAMNQDSYATSAAAFRDAYERLASCSQFKVPANRLQQLQAKVRHFQVRTHMRDKGVRRLPLIWQEVVRGHYRRYSLGWKSLAQDIFL